MSEGRETLMDGRPARNLEEMDEQEAREFLMDLLTKLSPEEEYDLRHESYVMENAAVPGTHRRRDNMRAFQEPYPEPPTIELRRQSLIFRNMFLDERDADIARVLWNYFGADEDRWAGRLERGRPGNPE
jgi:hypothetical protein